MFNILIPSLFSTSIFSETFKFFEEIKKSILFYYSIIYTYVKIEI